MGHFTNRPSRVRSRFRVCRGGFGVDKRLPAGHELGVGFGTQFAFEAAECLLSLTLQQIEEGLDLLSVIGRQFGKIVRPVQQVDIQIAYAVGHSAERRQILLEP